MKKQDRIVALLQVANRELTAVEMMAICNIWLIGSVYPILFRLEFGGIITSRFVEGPEPRRRVYSLKESP